MHSRGDRDERFGFLALLKPCDISSHDLVAHVRKTLGVKRVGHTGTLDPAACGVMVVAVGKATRLIPFLPSHKSYVADVCFGLASDTADAEGHVSASEAATALTKEQVESELGHFRGDIVQRPPMTAAVHVRGRRLYEWAHDGHTFDEEDIPTRRVRIDEMRMLSFRSGERAGARFYVRCAAGTYIRSLAVDLGRQLGLPAYLPFLLRTESNGVGIAHAQTLDAFDAAPHFLPHSVVLGHMPEVVLDDEQIGNLRLGRQIPGEPVEWARVYDTAGHLAAVVRRIGQMWQPDVVF